jgi:hypothetical protein
MVARLLDMTKGATDAAGALRQLDTALPWQTARSAEAAAIRQYMNDNANAAADLSRQQAAALQGVYARSPAEKAAAARAAVAAEPIDPKESPAVRALREEQAATLALATAQRSLSEAQRDRVRSYDETLASAQLDIDLVGRTAGEAARLRMEFQLTARLREEAAKNGIEVDQAELLLIKQKAAAAGELATALARASLRDNLTFERDQLGRSAIDQTIASTLRGAGLPLDFNSTEAGIIRVNEQLKLGKEIATDWFGGMRNDLKNGVSLLDAMSNAAGRLADRLLDMALNNGIQSFVNAIMGAFGGSPLPGSTAIGRGGIGHMKGGGAIFGPGTGTSDSILIAASNGEFMVNAAATARHRPLLEAINDNRSLPRFAAGGYIGPTPGSASSVAGPMPLVIINESGNTVRDGGIGSRNGAPVQQLIIGAAADDVAGGGSLGRAIENTFGLRRVVR